MAEPVAGDVEKRDVNRAQANQGDQHGVAGRRVHRNTPRSFYDRPVGDLVHHQPGQQRHDAEDQVRNIVALVRRMFTSIRSGRSSPWVLKAKVELAGLGDGQVEIVVVVRARPTGVIAGFVPELAAEAHQVVLPGIEQFALDEHPGIDG